MYKFDAKDAIEKCVKWIQDWFEANGNGCNAVIGISGGKDSTVAAGLLVKALGKDRVIGVMMPNHTQSDISDSQKVCDFLDIRHYRINIGDSVDVVIESMLKGGDFTISEQTLINLPPRIRMSTLYAVSQSNNGRVVNTCNYSEDYVGYSTRYGDSAGDFSPLGKFTKTEVCLIGKELGLPIELVDKAPSDGLCGKTDEDNLGFTYAELDAYIREGIEPDAVKKAKINRLHKMNLFKLEVIPTFDYKGGEE